MGAEGQWSSGYRGPEEQWVQRNSGYKGPEEQWVKKTRGTVRPEEQWAQRTRGTVGTEELFNKFLDKHPQKARLCQEHHIDPEDDNIDLAQVTEHKAFVYCKTALPFFTCSLGSENLVANQTQSLS